MIAYKLFKVRRNGTLGPLFINKRQIIRLGVWLAAESHPTKGYALRPGWHCTHAPSAPHLNGKREKRAWFKVEIQDFEPHERPACQGGLWYTAARMKVLGAV